MPAGQIDGQERFYDVCSICIPSQPMDDPSSMTWPQSIRGSGRSFAATRAGFDVVWAAKVDAMHLTRNSLSSVALQKAKAEGIKGSQTAGVRYCFTLGFYTVIADSYWIEWKHISKLCLASKR